MNVNRIDNIEMWTEEILDLTKKNSLYEDLDGDRYEKLIFMAEDTKEIKVVQGLMRCLEYELPGMDQTITDVLSTVDPLTYYNALFELLPKILYTTDARYTFMAILAQSHILEYSKDIWEKIYNIAKEYLSKRDLEKIILLYKEDGYAMKCEYFPYPEFYQLFQKLLKEKSDN